MPCIREKLTTRADARDGSEAASIGGGVRRAEAHDRRGAKTAFDETPMADRYYYYYYEILMAASRLLLLILRDTYGRIDIIIINITRYLWPHRYYYY